MYSSSVYWLTNLMSVYNRVAGSSGNAARVVQIPSNLHVSSSAPFLPPAANTKSQMQYSIKNYFTGLSL